MAGDDTDPGDSSTGINSKQSPTAVIEAKDSNIPEMSSDASIELGDAALPKGTLDPVYEAKARVLNRAVRKELPDIFFLNIRYRYPISMRYLYHRACHEF